MPGMVGRLTAGRGRLERFGDPPGAGVRDGGQRHPSAIGLVRERNPSPARGVAWWGFDIAVLWACFHAFGALAAEGA